MRTLMVALVVALCPLRAAFAWGDTAHQAICEIAFQEVSDTTRTRIKALILQDPQFSTFAEACIWPDHPRIRATEHYVNLPRDADGIGDDPCPLANECVVTAITSDLSVLRSDADDSTKLAALKSLGHWVGDVHQPLHVSFEDDRGGNSIKESGPCNNSLHSVWDSCIVQRGLPSSPAAIAQALRAEITEADRTAWRNSGPVDWANESFQIVTSAAVAYCVRKDESCWYDADHEQLIDGVAEKTVVVDGAYITTNLPTVRARMKRAGVRLGALLDEALGGPADPSDPPAVSISALLPNPPGLDAGNERVTLRSAAPQVVPLSGWKLVDRAGNIFELSDQIDPASELDIALAADSMPLNNTGDEVRLVAPGERVVSTVRYDSAASGQVLQF